MRVDSDVPVWAQKAFNRAVSEGDYYDMGSQYVFTVEQETCDRFECTIEVWRGVIDADEYDNVYDGEIDPTKQKERLGWEDLSITKL